MHYSDPGLVRANRVDRDKIDNDDTVSVSFDPSLDQQLGYFFSVNGYGVQSDAVLKGGSGSNANPDKAWDVLFASAGQRVDDGWTAELAIPFKSLRYPARGPGEMHQWGFQVERQIQSKNETVDWSPISRDVAGFMRQMGVLTGLTDLSTSRNFEFLPSFTAITADSLNRTTGIVSATDVEEGGVNLKYGLTPNLTFDFTFNPDFSQIESDTQQIQVNLRFPISFPELRPFFLEGADIFSLGGPSQLVHTRTIVDPQFGAKLTGKVGKTTLNLLVANDQAPGKVDDPQDPAFDRAAEVYIARARYDFRPESSFGAILTGREFLNSYSRLVGMDTTLRLGRTMRFRAYGMFSDRRDTAGVRRTGNTYEINVRKESRNVMVFVASHGFTPDFGTELGFYRRVDYRETEGNISYRWWPENWIVNWGPRFSYIRTYDYQGILQNAAPSGTLNVQFAKNINASATVSRAMERYREIDFNKTRVSFSGTVNASRRILFTGKIDRGDEIRFAANPYLGHNTIYSATATLRPLSRVQSAIKLDTTKFVDVRSNTQAFDVKILRVQTTYQFTPRLLVRNIMQRNTFNKTLDANLLVTYRVNSGTAFYVGYDDHYTQADAINAQLFPGAEFERTNRAIFTKLQYLFRNGSN